ncbi:MAG: glycosyltransferase [Psychroflexus maritimus]
MKKQKVLHITETFVTGVYTYIKDICEYCNEIDEIESHVIFSGEREETDLEFITSDFKGLAQLHQVQMSREIDALQDFKSTLSIYKKIRQIQPDIIHLHSSKASVIGRIAARLYGKAKVFYTPNGYSFLRQDVSKNKKKFYWLIEKYTQKIFGGTSIACGDTEYEHATKIKKSFLVRNGIDTNSLNHIPRNIPAQVKKIGTIGRLSPQKNPELFNAIALSFPEVEFIWIGGGEMQDKLTASNIKSLGWLDREDALKEIAKVDLYIQTSLWEGLPFTIIEAMTLERPVVATNVVGNKDAVSHGENGYLCEDLSDFQKYISDLIKQPESLEKMSAKSLERARKLFDRNRNFKDLINFYLSSTN